MFKLFFYGMTGILHFSGEKVRMKECSNLTTYSLKKIGSSATSFFEQIYGKCIMEQNVIWRPWRPTTPPKTLQVEFESVQVKIESDESQVVKVYFLIFFIL